MALTKKGQEGLNKLNSLTKISPQLGLRILKEVGADGLKESIKEAPRDSDSMVSTGRMEVVKLTVKIIFGGILAKFTRAGRELKFVDYAKFVHDGTIKMAARPFLQKGINRALVKTKSIGKQAFNNWISKVK